MGEPARNEDYATTTPPKSRILKSGAPAHIFTPEDRAKGARRSAEVRREKAMTHSQRIRARVEKQEKQLVDALVAKAKEGNVQALQMLWSYAYGLPAKVEPDQLDVSVSSDDGPRGVNLAQVLELAQRTGVDAKVDASNPD
jgi:hypothetical protein